MAVEKSTTTLQCIHISYKIYTYIQEFIALNHNFQLYIKENFLKSFQSLQMYRIQGCRARLGKRGAKKAKGILATTRIKQRRTRPSGFDQLKNPLEWYSSGFRDKALLIKRIFRQKIAYRVIGMQVRTINRPVIHDISKFSRKREGDQPPL